MLSYVTLPGDIDRMIADDHAVVNRLFEHLQAGRGDRRMLVDQVGYLRNLQAHAEDAVLVPAMLTAGMSAQVQARCEANQNAKRKLALLDQQRLDSARFDQELYVLIGDLRRHMGKQEHEYLPELRRAVGADEMGRLGERFVAAKLSAHRRSRPRSPGASFMHKIRVRLSGPRATLDASGLLDQQAQQVMDVLAGMRSLPYEILTPQQARRQPTIADAVSHIVRKSETPAVPARVGKVDDITIPGPGGDLTVRVYKPTGAGGTPRPAVVWIHGGGWVLHTNDTYDASARALVDQTGAVVLSPEYRKAPEHVFPAAHDDVLATYRWARGNASELGLDPSRLAIGGEGVGGTMAAATCVQLKKAGEPLPVAQVLAYPLTTTDQFGGSMADAADAKPLNLPLLSWLLMHAFRGVERSLKDPRVDLLSLPIDELCGLPPTLVLTVDRDVLQSQSDEFARRLTAAGVPTKTIRYGGVMHDFLGAAAVLDTAALAMQEAAVHLLRAFGSNRAAQPKQETATAQTPIGS